MSTILIVDDMAICREPIAATLRQHAYDTLAASSGAEALSIMRDSVPDLVLLDVSMPGLDGLAVLRTIRRNPDWHRIPVVLLTDRAEVSIVKKAAEAGAAGYLLKSQFSLDDLLARVERCLHPTSASPHDAERPAGEVEDAAYRSWRSNVEGRRVAAPAAGAVASPPVARPRRVAQPDSIRGGQRATLRSVAELTPVITKDELVRLVNDGLALRPLGATVHNVITVTGSSGCCAEDVANAVSRDQSLCIRLLKLANTSAYSRGHLVDSVKEAVRRIGIAEVRALVMTLGVFEQFEGGAAEHFSPHLFWEHSIACGLAAAAIAKARNLKDSDKYFLWGMVHDVGRLILLEHAGDKYASVWEAAEQLGLPLEAVEGRMLLMDHCNILERALERWQFPREFIVPVVNHHCSASKLRRLQPAQTEAAATVSVADHLTHALLLGSSGNDVLYPLDDLVELLQLEPAVISSLVDTLQNETRDLKLAMLSRTSDRDWPDFAVQVHERIATDFRPLCISLVPELDPARLLCERVAGNPGTPPPNIVVMYLRDAREFAQLTMKFGEREGRALSTDTPVVLIVAKGKVDPSQPWLEHRPHALLTAPVRIDDFISTVRELLA